MDELRERLVMVMWKLARDVSLRIVAQKGVQLMAATLQQQHGIQRLISSRSAEGQPSNHTYLTTNSTEVLN